MTNPENKFTTFENSQNIDSIHIFINGHHIIKIKQGDVLNFDQLALKYYNKIND